MKEIILEVEPREVSTRNKLKMLRLEGKIPAVFYGAGEKTLPVFVDRMKFEKLLHSGITSNVLINLKIGKKTKSVIIKELQRDMLTQKPMHIDFHAVTLTKKIEVEVPFHFIGEAPGVKNSGGVLEHILREVKVKCLPTSIPAFIEVNVSGLGINQAIAVKDLPKMEGVEIITDLNSIIVNVVSPTELEEKPAVEEAIATETGPAEPEVISKGKKEKEEEVPEPGKKPEQAKKDTESKKKE